MLYHYTLPAFITGTSAGIDEFSDYVVDNGLTALHTLADHIHLLPSAPTTYADVITLTLGNKSWSPGGAVAAPVAASDGNGRTAATTAFNDGNITSDGFATKWAVVDSVNSRLLVNGSLSGGFQVKNGDQFLMASFNMTLREH
jgi:hypothetical protein